MADLRTAMLHDLRVSRRSFLRESLRTAGALAAGASLGFSSSASAGRARARTRGATNYGPLQSADANGIQLPFGFSSSVVAVSGQKPGGSSYTWHGAPDGGATFAQPDGGWIYVSNSEAGSGGGGAGALRFDAAANVVDAYGILSGTSRNCAGGPTPWGSWVRGVERRAGLGVRSHPAVAGRGPPRARHLQPRGRGRGRSARPPLSH